MAIPITIAGTPPSRNPSTIRCRLISTFSVSSPDRAISMSFAMIALGAGKKRTSIKPVSAASSQASNRPSGEAMLRIRSRRRAASRARSPTSTTRAGGFASSTTSEALIAVLSLQQ